MGRGSPREKTSRGSAFLLIGCTVFGALLGLPVMGKLGLLAGALGGLCIAIVVDASIRAKQSPHLKDGRQINLAGLNAQQQLAMLGQGLTAGAGDFRSAVLRDAEQAKEAAEEDLELGLRMARELAQTHGRSPAAWSLVGELATRAGQDEEAQRAHSNAFEFAALAGLNQVLVEQYDTVDTAALDELELSRAAWTQVAAALRARGRGDDASAAAKRAEAIDPDIDEARRAEAFKLAAAALRESGDKEAAEVSDQLAQGES